MAKKTPVKKPASKPAPKKSAPSASSKAKAPAPKSKAPAAKAASAKPAAKPAKAAAEKPAKGAVAAEKPAKKPAAKAAPDKPSKAAAPAKKGAAEASAKAKAPAAKSKPEAAPAAEKSASKKSEKSGSSSKKGGSAGSQNGPAFLSEPGPRFRSPFSGSASTAKEAAARMAEAAGLTAIRAATVKQAPTLKKFKKITETPLPEKQLEEFRVLLEEKRVQLVGDVSSMEREALGGDGGSLSRLPQHMADQGTDTYDQSLNLDLAASQRGIVKEIDAALDRIANRTFGVCELLGKPIGIDRLRNAPWTRYSIEAARMLELNPELARVSSSSEDESDSDEGDADDDV